MDFTTLIGAAATIASTASFAPQAWKIIRSRDTHSISTGMYAVTVAAFALWVIYGLQLGAWPLIVSSAICLTMSAFILVMKLLPQRHKETVAEALDPED